MHMPSLLYNRRKAVCTRARTEDALMTEDLQEGTGQPPSTGSSFLAQFVNGMVSPIDYMA